jgi:hypothetical protein
MMEQAVSANQVIFKLLQSSIHGLNLHSLYVCEKLGTVLSLCKPLMDKVNENKPRVRR